MFLGERFVRLCQPDVTKCDKKLFMGYLGNIKTTNLTTLNEQLNYSELYNRQGLCIPTTDNMNTVCVGVCVHCVHVCKHRLSACVHVSCVCVSMCLLYVSVGLYVSVVVVCFVSSKDTVLLVTAGLSCASHEISTEVYTSWNGSVCSLESCDGIQLFKSKTLALLAVAAWYHKRFISAELDKYPILTWYKSCVLSRWLEGDISSGNRLDFRHMCPCGNHVV